MNTGGEGVNEEMEVDVDGDVVRQRAVDERPRWWLSEKKQLADRLYFV